MGRDAYGKGTGTGGLLRGEVAYNGIEKIGGRTCLNLPVLGRDPLLV